MIENEVGEYLINIENSLVNREKIDINDKKFEKVMFLYRAALKELKTKIDILQEELKLFSGYEPVEYVITRIKKPESILNKLERKDLEPTYENMFEKIDDIAGIRIVCNFKSDVYKLVDIISSFQDVRLLDKKDYLKNPKTSGYRSYHIILEVPVNFSSGIMYVKVELQIRTLAMDFWASLEHKLKYKNQRISKQDSKNLIKYAKIIDNIDENMLNISNRNKKEEKVNLILEAAEENTKAKKFTFKL
ncbi:MAG: GTP pyrophosphokinase family protein [Clostridia bacterium]|nr:GTP pyrophosphokinase family protein [Clostridia bacterium]